MDHGSVQPPRPAPVFLRIDGTVRTVEVLVGLKAGAQQREVSTTRHQYDPRANAYVVTLEPGAELTTSPDGDERYETRR